jgi:transcriptional antiterminator
MKMNFTREELAHYFECSRKTLYNKLHKANLRLKRGLLTLEQIYLICEQLGYPKPTLERSKLKLPPLKR